MDDIAEISGRLARGRGSAVREALALDPAGAQQILLSLLLATDGPLERTQHVHGYIDIVKRHDLNLKKYFEWLSGSGPSKEDDLLFHCKFIAECVARGVGDAWGFLWHKLRQSVGCNTWLFEAASLLPAECWLLLMPSLSDQDLIRLVDRHDLVWFRVWRMSPRVQQLIPDASEIIGKARVSYSAEEYSSAVTSTRRFAVLRDAILSGDPNVSDCLAEGLWDASDLYRHRCIELVDITIVGVQARLSELVSSTSSIIALAAARRLRQVWE